MASPILSAQPEPTRLLPAASCDATSAAPLRSRLPDLRASRASLAQWARDGLLPERARVAAISGAVATPLLYAAKQSMPRVASLAALVSSPTALKYLYTATSGLMTLSMPIVAMQVGLKTMYNGLGALQMLRSDPNFLEEGEELPHEKWLARASLLVDGIGLGLSVGALAVSSASAGAMIAGVSLCALLAISMTHNTMRLSTAAALASSYNVTMVLGEAAPAFTFALAGGASTLAAISSAAMAASITAFMLGAFTLVSLATRLTASGGSTAHLEVSPRAVAGARLTDELKQSRTVLSAPSDNLATWQTRLLSTQQCDSEGLRFFSGMPMLTLVGPRGAGLTSTALGLARELDADVLRTSGAQLHDYDRRGVQDMPATMLLLLLCEAEERARRCGRLQMILLEHANLFCPAVGAQNSREKIIALDNLISFNTSRMHLNPTRQSVVWVLTSEENEVGIDTLPLLNTHAPVFATGLTAQTRAQLIENEVTKLSVRAAERGTPLGQNFATQLLDTIAHTRLANKNLTGRHIVVAVAAGEVELDRSAAERDLQVIAAIDRALSMRERPAPKARKRVRSDVLDSIVGLAGGDTSDIFGLVQTVASVRSSAQVAALANPEAAALASVQRQYLDRALERRMSRTFASAEVEYFNAYNDAFCLAVLAKMRPHQGSIGTKAQRAQAVEHFMQQHHAHALIPSMTLFAVALSVMEESGFSGIFGLLREQYAGRREAHFLIASPEQVAAQVEARSFEDLWRYDGPVDVMGHRPFGPRARGAIKHQ